MLDFGQNYYESWMLKEAYMKRISLLAQAFPRLHLQLPIKNNSNDNYVFISIALVKKNPALERGIELSNTSYRYIVIQQFEFPALIMCIIYDTDVLLTYLLAG